jgi:hypothetical protein
MSKTRAPRRMALPTLVDGLDTPVWGAENFAMVLNCTPRRVNHLLQHGSLDADKFGRLWCSTPRRLLKPRKLDAAE